MLETIMEYHIIFYVMGAIGVLGLISKFIANVTLKRLVKAASNMNKSTHGLMRLVRAKFEHACMVSDKVQNVEAFVDKYLYEYRVMGIRLHTWQQLEKQWVWIAGIFAVLGTAFQYNMYGMSELVFRYGAIGAAEMTALFLLHISTDERHRLSAARTYMIDYLENVCAHRYEKAYAQRGTVESAQESITRQEGQAREQVRVNERVTAAQEQEIERPKAEGEAQYAYTAAKDEKASGLFKRVKTAEKKNKKQEADKDAVIPDVGRPGTVPEVPGKIEEPQMPHPVSEPDILQNPAPVREPVTTAGMQTMKEQFQQVRAKEEALEERGVQEAIIREILEEFLA